MELVEFREELLQEAVRLCAGGVRRMADRIDRSLLRPPEKPEPVVETMLRQFLAADDRRAWAVVDGGEVRAFAGALVERLTPDDARYTYLPPRSVTITASTMHAVSHAAARECFPLLLDRARQVAGSIGGKLFLNVLPGDPLAELWRGLGLRPGSVMARRQVRTWRSPGPPPSGVEVRVAGPHDVEALTDLALEEHRYHAEHTSAGVSLDQPRETSRRLAADSVTAPTDTNHQLVAEDSSGKVVGSIVGTIYQLADDQIQRYLLPPRYGYVGLTVVTEAARGTGVGRPLIDATMGWFAGRGVQTAFLHYIPDNPLSSRFWPRAGFQPHIEIYSSR